MVDVVGSVTAKLILDSSEFTSGLDNAIESVKNLQANFKGFDINSTVEQIKNLENELKNSNETINKQKETINQLESEYKQLNDSIKTNTEIQTTLNTDTEKTVTVYEQLEQAVNQASNILEKINAVTERNIDNFKVTNETLTLTGKSFERFNSIAGSLSSNLSKNSESFSQLKSELNAMAGGLSGYASEVEKSIGADFELGNSATFVRNMFSELNAEVNKSANEFKVTSEGLHNASLFFERVGMNAVRSGEEIAQFEKNIIKAQEALMRGKEFTLFDDILTKADRATKDTLKVKEELESVRSIMNKTDTVKVFTSMISEARKANTILKQLGDTGEASFNKITLTIQKGTEGLSKFQSQVLRDMSALKELEAIARSGGLSNTFMTGYSPNISSGLTKDIEALNKYIAETEKARYNTEWFGTALDGLKAKEESVSVTTQKLGNNATQASARMDSMYTATTRLEKGLSSLKLVGSAVASMFVWTFGMSLWEATKQTVESKNEMESYFTQMGMSEKSISTFNKGLDETVKKFSKLNKYMIGETIASIGMEFDLTAKQMKSSMDVVAMIQNEYVRAGRKESEANLAVKDILQGEFLRLSRETGVGKQDLIDTGVWDGNLKDIENLMNALRIVGEDRHWDLFASKCTSLNDVIATTRNRVSEFTATLIDDLSPVIVEVFNRIIGVVDGFTNTWDGFDIGTKIVASIGSFIALSTILMTVSGKVGLAEMAMYGYGNSLMATILKMDVATVKEYGHLSAIMAKITGYEAETVASMGSGKALVARLLGINSNISAEAGLKTALLASAIANNQNTIATRANELANKGNIVTTEGVTIKTNAYTTAKDLESMAEASNTTEKEANALMSEASALAELEASTATDTNTASIELNSIVKALNSTENIGLLGTLVMLTTGMEAETVATMSATEAMWAFITSATVVEALTVVAVLAVIAVSFAELGAEIIDTTSKMKEFNDMVNNGEEIIQKYYDNLHYFQQEEENVREQLNHTEKGTLAYESALKHLEVATKNTEQAQRDLESAIKAVNQATAMTDWVDDEKIRITTESNAELSEQMKKQGFDQKQIDSVNRYYTTAQFGVAQLYKGLQVYHKQQDDTKKNEEELYKKLSKNNVPKEEQVKWIQDLTSAYGDLEQHSYVANTSDDFFESATNHIYAGMDQFRIDWINFWADPDFEDALGGLAHIGENLPMAKFGDWVNDIFGGGEKIDAEKGLIEALSGIDVVGSITEWFDNIEIPDIPKMFLDAITGGKDKTGKSSNGDIDISSLLGAIGVDTDGVATWVDDNIIHPFTEPITDFLSDPLGSIEDFTFSGVDFFRGLLGIEDDGSDPMMVDTTKMWLHNNIFKPIGDTWDEFVSDPLGFIESTVFDGNSLLDGLLGDVTPESVMGMVDSSIIQPFGSAISTGLANIPIVGDVLSMLGLIDGTSDTASEKGTNIGTAFGDAVEDYIRNIPIVGDVLSWLGLIDSTTPTAKSKGDKVGSNVKQGVDSGKQGTAGLVRDEMDSIITEMSNKISSVWGTAQKIGSSILGGINSIIQHHSPGVPALLIRDEMDEIGYSMDSKRDAIFRSAQAVSQAITDGINPNTDISLNGDVLSQYRMDSIQAMTLTDNTVANAESSFSTLDVNTGITFGNIGNTISTTMSNIAGTTKSNYNTIVTTTKAQLGNMQSETTKNINQIKTSWNGMQTALIQSAENIRSETGQKIHSLQNNMATFWRKVQNPALLLSGAGSPSEEKGGARPRRFGSIGGRVRKALSPKGVAGNPNIGSKSTGISSMFTPKGNTSIKMLDALDMIYEAMMDDKPHYFGGWDFNWSKDIKDALLKWHTHFGAIYDPYLSVGKFENDNFPVRGIAEIARNYIYDAISRTSYEFYYDSKYGSPLASWNAGHFNCYDGALLVMALARAFGFPNSTMVHGSWNGIAHVWARIAGLGDIDATAIQGGYGFTAPSRTGSAGGLIQRFKHNKEPSNKSEGNTINGDVIININGDGDKPKGIAKEVRNVLIDLFNPNPAKGY